ncbi:MAG: hypothetical protein ACKKL5_02235 [Candidatus Komeilibacteria bacterium]
MSKSAAGSMSDWSGLLKDMFRQIDDGTITRNQLHSFVVKHENPFAITDIRQEWQEFYRKYFRLTVDFTDVTIPESPDDFSRVVFIPQGLSYADIVKVLKKKFKVYLYTENLDKGIRNDVRTSNQAYAVCFRERVEADEEWKNTSADMLKEKGINSITLMERLILELKYYDETGEHLDISNVTLCAGSRHPVGVVPGVRWDGGWLQVDWCPFGIADGSLRVRVAVS